MKAKKRGKRLLSILLCFVMLLGLVPMTAFAAESTDITDYIDSYRIGGKTYWNVSQSNSGEGWRYEVRLNTPTIILNGYNGGEIRFNMKSDAPATAALLSVSGTNNVDGMIYAGQMDYINLQINLSSGAVLNASEIYTSPNYGSEAGNLSHVIINGPASGEYASVNIKNDAGVAITVGCKAEVISNLGNVVAHVYTQALGKLYCSGRVNVIAHSVTDHAIYSGFKYEYVENFVDSSVARYYYQCTGINIANSATLLAYSDANGGTKSAINNYEPHMKPFSGEPLFDSIPDDYAAVYPDNCDLIYFAPREVLREYLDFTNPLSDTTVEVGTQTYTIGVKALPSAFSEHGFNLQKSYLVRREGQERRYAQGVGDSFSVCYMTPGKYTLTEGLALRSPDNEIIDGDTRGAIITVVDKLCAHTFVEISNTATCTKDGVKTERCTLCGETKTTNIVAGGHDPIESHMWDETTHWQGCKNCQHIATEENHTLGSNGKCTVCGYDSTNTCGHDYAEGQDDTYHWYECNVHEPDECPNHGKLELGMHEIRPVTEPTGEGYTPTTDYNCMPRNGNTRYGYVCEGCGNYFGPEENHKWVLNAALSTPATADAPGKDVYTCKYNGKVDVHNNTITCTARKEVVLPALGHNWDYANPVSDTATCTEDGLVTYKCLDDGCTKTLPEKSYATGHEWGEWSTVTPATCTTAGSKTHKCLRCHATENEPIDALGHSYGTDWEADETHHWHECSCGAKANEANHSGGNATCITRAVCSECGSQYGECNSAIHYDTKELKKDSNQHWYEWKCCNAIDGAKVDHSGGTAACQAKAECATCGEIYGEFGEHDYDISTWGYKGADGHAHYCKTTGCTEHDTITDHIPGAAATETEPQTCTACGYVIKAALGHICKNHLTFVEAKAADCTTAGNKAYYKCSCNKLYSDANATTETTLADVTIAALDHDMKTEWSKNAANHWHDCTRCDYAEDYAAHIAGPAATETTPQTCTACGYVMANATGYTITFDANGGVVDTPTAQTDKNGKLTLTVLPEATRDGKYNFAGWFDAQRGGNKITTDTIFTENTTVYAHWTYTGGGSGGGGGTVLPIYHTIKATAGVGGSISPDGTKSLPNGGSQTYTITPDSGYEISDVKVDGKSVGAVKTYTFRNVKENHTIQASFEKVKTNPNSSVFQKRSSDIKRTSPFNK